MEDRPAGLAHVTALVLVAASLILSQPGFAQEQLCGPAAAEKDGDDLEITDLDIRLHGIDAFEANQTCTRSNGEVWACGEAALKCVADACKRRRRAAARPCAASSEKDIGQEMVRAGLAFDPAFFP